MMIVITENIKAGTVTDWMHLFWMGAPTRSTIRYFQHGNRPNNGVVLSCGGFPLTELSLEWGNSAYSSALRFR